MPISSITRPSKIYPKLGFLVYLATLVLFHNKNGTREKLVAAKEAKNAADDC
jgi:hypothetical protein